MSPEWERTCPYRELGLRGGRPLHGGARRAEVKNNKMQCMEYI